MHRSLSSEHVWNGPLEIDLYILAESQSRARPCIITRAVWLPVE